MDDPSNEIKKILLLDMEKVYSVLKKLGYTKYPPDQFRLHSDALLQKKHWVNSTSAIYINIHVYAPVPSVKADVSFEVELRFETDRGYWANIGFYTLNESNLVQEINWIESKLVAAFNLFNGVSD